MTNSICGPSRATILTGKYSHKNGFYDNTSRFDGSQTTLPKLLQQAGYQTAVIGKWHLVSDPTGFDHWDVLPGQGDYYRPTFITAAGRHNVPGYVTDITTQKALAWLDEKRDPSKPFFLMVHHKAPHRRWDPPVKYLTKFADELVAEPPTLMDDYSNRGAAAKRAEMRIEQMDAESDLKLWGRRRTDAHLALQSHDAGRARGLAEARRSAAGGNGEEGPARCERAAQGVLSVVH